MQRLRYKADVRTLVFVIIYFMLAYTGFIFYDRMPWWLVTLLVIITCQFTFFVAITVHNTIHCPIFMKKRWNKAFQFVLSVAYGYSVSAFVPGHNFSHHKETQTAKDAMRTTKARFRWNFLNQLLFFFIVSIDLLPYEFRWVNRMKKEKPSWYWQYMSEIILVNVVKIGLLFVNWQAALLFIWLPHFYAVWGVVGTNMWQHDGCDETHPYNHSRNFTSKWLNFICFNNGFHGAHHEKPGLHWSKLPAYHRKNIASHIHPNLNRVSLFKYLWEANIWPGKRVDYLGNPMPRPAKVKDKDWIEGVKLSSHKNDLGAEALA